MSVQRVLLAAVATLATAVWADEATPTPAEIKRVLEYEQHGKDRGPILIELVPCLKVDLEKGSPNYYACVEAIKGPIKRDTVVNAWMAWLCPKGGMYDDITVQFVHQGQVRRTFDLKIEGLSRTRTMRSQPLSKPGTWQIKVARGDQELATVEVTVE